MQKTFLLATTTFILSASAFAVSSPAGSLMCRATYLNPSKNFSGSLPQEGSVIYFNNDLLEGETSFKPKSFPGHDYASLNAGDKYIMYGASIERSENKSDVMANIYVMDKVSNSLLGSTERIILTKNITDFGHESSSLDRTSFGIKVRLTDKAIEQIQKDTDGKDENGNTMKPTWISITCYQEK